MFNDADKVLYIVFKRRTTMKIGTTSVTIGLLYLYLLCFTFAVEGGSM